MSTVIMTDAELERDVLQISRAERARQGTRVTHSWNRVKIWFYRHF